MPAAFRGGHFFAHGSGNRGSNRAGLISCIFQKTQSPSPIVRSSNDVTGALSRHLARPARGAGMKAAARLFDKAD
jgi:hypothetical protein